MKEVMEYSENVVKTCLVEDMECQLDNDVLISAVLEKLGWKIKYEPIEGMNVVRSPPSHSTILRDKRKAQEKDHSLLPPESMIKSRRMRNTVTRKRNRTERNQSKGVLTKTYRSIRPSGVEKCGEKKVLEDIYNQHIWSNK